ncbi:MAG TPA: hypothetical protein VKV18_15060 [Chthonomonas sp.]|uniref:hypothetical protein n=1 Tax=Chthonomonas sp. TaxID=2282153 RepID=UPI002B4B4316|nr:hypothetical protein [Chthonomonas sp.]HLI49988.1 hypothetical protein [Chthonomonas sp.]
MIAFHLFLSACIGLLLEFATGIALGQTVNRSQPISIEQIENACQQVQQRIQSVQVSYKYRQSSTPAFDALVKSAGNNVIVAKVIESRTWAEKGKKFYLLQEPQDGVSEKNIEVYDGQRFHQLEVQSKRQPIYDEVSNSYVLPGSPFTCAYRPFGDWLADTLHKENGRILTVLSDPVAGTLYEISCKTPQGFTHLLWLAPNYGWAAVRASTVIQGRERIRVVCSDFKPIEGVWLPTICRVIKYGSQRGRQVAYGEQAMTDAQYELNNVPDSLFEVHLPEGSIVFDLDRHARYVIGPGGIRYNDPRTEMVQSVPHYLFAWLFIGILTALVLILSGIFIGWRRKQRGV